MILSKKVPTIDGLKTYNTKFTIKKDTKYLFLLETHRYLSCYRYRYLISMIKTAHF